jgi:hypothetical protein
LPFYLPLFAKDFTSLRQHIYQYLKALGLIQNMIERVIIENEDELSWQAYLDSQEDHY